MDFLQTINQAIFGRTFLPHSLARARKLNDFLRGEQGLFLDFGSADCKVETFIDVIPPQNVEDKFIRRGVADRTNLGPKITGLGRIILDEAQSSGRIAKFETI